MMFRNWQSPLDLYCERTGPSLGAEPLNLVTNVGFLLASAWLLRVVARSPRPTPPGARVLALLLGLIGVGSGLFHSFATVWAQAADVIPIQIYIVAMLSAWLRHVHGWGRGPVTLAVVGLMLLSLILSAVVPGDLVNGSQGYFGTLIFMGWLGMVQAKTPVGGREFGGATLLFAVSLIFRMIDQALCPHWALGTHFVWHLCNAVVCYLPLKAYLRLADGGEA